MYEQGLMLDFLEEAIEFEDIVEVSASAISKEELSLSYIIQIHYKSITEDLNYAENIWVLQNITEGHHIEFNGWLFDFEFAISLMNKNTIKAA